MLDFSLSWRYSILFLVLCVNVVQSLPTSNGNTLKVVDLLNRGHERSDIGSQEAGHIHPDAKLQKFVVGEAAVSSSDNEMNMHNLPITKYPLYNQALGHHKMPDSYIGPIHPISHSFDQLKQAREIPTSLYKKGEIDDAAVITELNSNNNLQVAKNILKHPKGVVKVNPDTVAYHPDTDPKHVEYVHANNQARSLHWDEATKMWKLTRSNRA